MICYGRGMSELAASSSAAAPETGDPPAAERQPDRAADRARLLAAEPRVGRQRLPDRVRRSAAARRPPGRPDRPAADVPRRPHRLHARLAALRPGAEPGDPDRRALPPG